MPGHEKKLVHERKLIREGKKVWCELHLYPAAQSGKQSPNRLIYYVWNDEYFATWLKDTVLAHIFEFDNIDGLPKHLRAKMGVVGAFPERRYGYGNGKDTLSKVGSLDPKSYPSKFEAERSTDSDGYPHYTLKAWMIDRVVYSRPTWVLTVDPAKGYLVTQGIYQFADLKVGKLSEYSVTPREISPGIWYPVQWDVTDYGNIDTITGEQPVAKISKYSMIDIEVPPAIDPQRFTWKSLSLPSETKFIRYDSSGESMPMKQVNGELVPNELG